jgi:hypothetical protein
MVVRILCKRGRVLLMGLEKRGLTWWRRMNSKLLCRVGAANMQVSRGAEHHHHLKKAAASKPQSQVFGYKVHQQVLGDAAIPESRQTRT